MRAGSSSPRRLRVALLAGGLDKGGAEKQLVHLVAALRAMDADVRVLTLALGGYYDAPLRALGVEPAFAGRLPGPAARVAELAGHLFSFRPHVVQATHSFVNLYAGLVGALLGSVSLGALRSSLAFCRKANGRWTRWLMTVPDAIVTNSEGARGELAGAGFGPERRLFVLPNAVDLAEFAPGDAGKEGAPATAVFVGRLVASKRLDVFLNALAAARDGGTPLSGVVVGDGPERAAGEALAGRLGLGSAVAFLGERHDVPALLAAADVFVLTSDDEGLPNVLLEAMAAGLPAVSTPAGEAARIVVPDGNGFLVPFGDAGAVAAALSRLAATPALRKRLGASGRETVRRDFALESLPSRLRALYRSAAELTRRPAILEMLP